MKRINGQKLGLKKLIIRVLSWITYVKRPFITSELQYALIIEASEFTLNQKNLPQIKDMVSVCVRLVTVNEENKII
jgi:hypothetical protein